MLEQKFSHLPYIVCAGVFYLRSKVMHIQCMAEKTFAIAYGDDLALPNNILT